MHWKITPKLPALALAAVGSVILLGACTKASPTPTPKAPTANNAVVTVTMDEWHLTPSVSSVPAGKVTFLAVGRGAEDHEVVIIKTDRPASSMVVKTETGKVDEAASGENVGEVEVEAGATEAATFNLTAGHYALICNIADATAKHYAKGMFADFTVK